jgi:NAD-specific glutamate dehydrogenase
LIYGFFLPPFLASVLPGQFNVQIRDESLKHNWFDQPVPSYFLANCKPTFVSVAQQEIGSAPNFLVAPYPVVGNGLFLVELWETSGVQQRIELVFGVLEPIGEACL